MAGLHNLSKRVPILESNDPANLKDTTFFIEYVPADPEKHPYSWTAFSKKWRIDSNKGEPLSSFHLRCVQAAASVGEAIRISEA